MVSEEIICSILSSVNNASLGRYILNPHKSGTVTLWFKDKYLSGVHWTYLIHTEPHLLSIAANLPVIVRVFQGFGNTSGGWKGCFISGGWEDCFIQHWRKFNKFIYFGPILARELQEFSAGIIPAFFGGIKR